MTEASRAAQVLGRLGMTVLERGWLSSNNIVFAEPGDEGVAVVDTGYAVHAAQTVALIERQLGGRSLRRVINTHLHSDHCGGNSELQARFGCDVWVPAASFDAVQRWDEERLTFERTDQRCERFAASRALHAGEEIELGGRPWQVVATPGHDPEAVVFFDPRDGVLIAGDALWRDRLAIIFPELAGEPGFDEARRALDTIEALAPSVVVPGHGAPFIEVADALRTARERLDGFERDPRRHFAYAARALAMFHMLEHRRRRLGDFEAWMLRAPILEGARRHAARDDEDALEMVRGTVRRLVGDGVLRHDDGWLSVPEDSR